MKQIFLPLAKNNTIWSQERGLEGRNRKQEEHVVRKSPGLMFYIVSFGTGSACMSLANRTFLSPNEFVDFTAG